MAERLRKGGFVPKLEDLERIALESGFKAVESKRYVGPAIDLVMGDGKLLTLGLGDSTVTFFDFNKPYRKAVYKSKPFDEIESSEDLANTIKDFIFLPPTEKETIELSDEVFESKREASRQGSISLVLGFKDKPVKMDESFIGRLQRFYKRLQQ